jgi:AcrR family transcriptional regulator
MSESLSTRARARAGRPRSEAPVAHAAIMDAVRALLQKTSVRDLTMEAIAKRAKVGKPTLYKWWPSKAALVLAMFNERLVGEDHSPPAKSAEAALRARVRKLITALNGDFGKVMADLIAEGQSEPGVLRDLFGQHVSVRRAAAIADVRRGQAAGEIAADVDPELMIDGMIGPIYFRLLMQHAPLTQDFGQAIVSQVLGGVRPSKPAEQQ